MSSPTKKQIGLIGQEILKVLEDQSREDIVRQLLGSTSNIFSAQAASIQNDTRIRGREISSVTLDELSYQDLTRQDLNKMTSLLSKDIAIPKSVSQAVPSTSLEDNYPNAGDFS